MPSKSLGLTVWGFVLGLAGCFSSEVPVPMEQDPAKTETPAPNTPSEVPGETGFVPIRFEDCTAYLAKPAGEEPTWTAPELDVIATTGTPRGYLYTQQTYRNFTLRGEFRFSEPATPLSQEDVAKHNTGFLIYVPEEHKIWPRSLEVQGRFDEMGQVKSNARDVTITLALDDDAARQQARRPVGEWNQIEIISQEGAVTAFLNGTKISASEPGELKTGHVALQAEDYPVEFRNLRIRED